MDRVHGKVFRMDLTSMRKWHAPRIATSLLTGDHAVGRVWHIAKRARDSFAFFATCAKARALVRERAPLRGHPLGTTLRQRKDGEGRV